MIDTRRENRKRVTELPAASLAVDLGDALGWRHRRLRWHSPRADRAACPSFPSGDPSPEGGVIRRPVAADLACAHADGYKEAFLFHLRIGLPPVMLLHCLGTTGYHPCELRHTACYFVPEAGLVLDAGTGLFRLTPLIETDELDILISHSHLDHVIGLTYLLEVMYRRPLRAVRVWGEAAKLEVIRQHLFHELVFPVLPDVTWHPLEEHGPTIGGGGRVQWFPLEHPGGSVGYRIDWPGRSLAYVTDTIADPQADYIRHLQGVDLLLHECYFRDSQREWAVKTGHSWTTRVAQVGRAAGASRLALVHINPMEVSDDPVEIDIAAAIHPDCIAAEDGMVLEF